MTSRSRSEFRISERTGKGSFMRTSTPSTKHSPSPLLDSRQDSSRQKPPEIGRRPRNRAVRPDFSWEIAIGPQGQEQRSTYRHTSLREIAIALLGAFARHADTLHNTTTNITTSSQNFITNTVLWRRHHGTCTPSERTKQLTIHSAIGRWLHPLHGFNICCHFVIWCRHAKLLLLSSVICDRPTVATRLRFSCQVRTASMSRIQPFYRWNRPISKNARQSFETIICRNKWNECERLVFNVIFCIFM